MSFSSIFILFSGDSAGGNLAAAVALNLKQTNYTHRPKVQVLVYPALQGFDMTLPSFIDNDNIVYGSRQSMAEVLLYYMGEDIRLASQLVSNNHTTDDLRQHYSTFLNRSLLPAKFQSKKDSLVEVPTDLESFGNPDVVNRLRRFTLDPLFAPLMAESLEGLPSAYIITAQFDVLRDEGVLYAERLRRSGVEVTWAHYDDAFHGFWAFFNPPIQLDAAVKCMNDLIIFLKQNL
jgi:acetyl esterase/lipase